MTKKTISLRQANEYVELTLRSFADTNTLERLGIKCPSDMVDIVVQSLCLYMKTAIRPLSVLILWAKLFPNCKNVSLDEDTLTYEIE